MLFADVYNHHKAIIKPHHTHVFLNPFFGEKAGHSNSKIYTERGHCLNHFAQLHMINQML